MGLTTIELHAYQKDEFTLRAKAEDPVNTVKPFRRMRTNSTKLGAKASASNSCLYKQIRLSTSSWLCNISQCSKLH